MSVIVNLIIFLRQVTVLFNKTLASPEKGAELETLQASKGCLNP